MLWGKINAKPFITIHFFKIFEINTDLLRSTSTRKPAHYEAKIRPTLL